MADAGAMEGGALDVPDMEQDKNIGNEMAAIPFQEILAGVLTAATDVQLEASNNAVKFLQDIGFYNEGPKKGQIRMITFTYTRPGGLMGMSQQKNQVRVPILCMVPIPTVRIEAVKVNFNVKITSMRKAQASYAGTSTEIQQDEQDGPSGVNDKSQAYKNQIDTVAMVTNQASTKQGMEVQREYSMKIVMHASQEGVPMGMQRILDILAGVIGRKSGEAGLSELMDGAFNLPDAGGGADGV